MKSLKISQRTNQKPYTYVYEKDRHCHAQKKNKPMVDKSPQTTNTWARRNTLKKDGELECFVPFGNTIKALRYYNNLPKRSRDATFICFEHSLIYYNNVFKFSFCKLFDCKVLNSNFWLKNCCILSREILKLLTSARVL